MTENRYIQGHIWYPPEDFNKPWTSMPQVFATFFRILLNAYHIPVKDGKNLIPKGGYKTNLKTFSKESGMSRGRLRRAIRTLRDFGEIQVERTGRNIIVSIVDFDRYFYGPDSPYQANVANATK